jgi:hypothetical protein
MTMVIRYVNMFVFVICVYGFIYYSFRLFYFVICGDFNFVPSYSIVESNYNMVFGIIGLLIISTFGGGSLM